MKLKKLVSIALAVVMALAMFTACTPADEGTGTPAGGKEVTITVWGEEGQQALYSKAFEEINAAFEKANPALKLTISGQVASILLQLQFRQILYPMYSSLRATR